MMPNFKPNGYNSVSPYFVVDAAQKLANLLKKLFEARELGKYVTKEGTIRARMVNGWQLNYSTIQKLNSISD